MRKPVFTIFYQYNPWLSSIGGIQTLISSFIKYAPEAFDLRLVGVGDRSTPNIGVWRETEFQGKVLQFLPLLAIENDDVRKLIPTTVKYAAALTGRCFASDFMHFHRLEPTVNTRSWRGDKTLFIHNDIRTQLLSKGSKQSMLWRHFPKLYFAIERSLIGQFDQVLSCNSESTKLYQELYPAFSGRFSYYRNSVDNETFYPLPVAECDDHRQAFAKELGLSAETRFMIFAGRLHPQKDPLLLVRSLAALKEPKIHLLIAGQGELAEAVRVEAAQLGVSKQVTLLGAVKPPKLAELHRLSSLCVLTSAYEGLPLVVLEALACGIPIVTTRAGDTPNVLTEQSGLVCEERTPRSVAEALRKVLNNPDYFSPQSCIQAAMPYGAKHVLYGIYDAMLQRWRNGS